jgi:hypothetical protein
MDKTKHTPGPWRLGHPDAVSELTIVADAVGVGYYGVIGGATQRDPHPVHGGGIPQAVAEANARLMIAAPELLDVVDLLCKQLVMAGEEPVKDSNSPIESLFYRALMARAKALPAPASPPQGTALECSDAGCRAAGHDHETTSDGEGWSCAHGCPCLPWGTEGGR